MNTHYKNIDEFPVFNWRLCLGGDLIYSRKNIEIGTDEDDANAWTLIYDDYIKKIGLGKNFEYILELQRDLAVLQCDYIIENNRFLLNSINILKDDIDEAIKNSQKSGEDMTTTLIKLGKWAGYRLNEKEVTVLELHKMIDLIIKENESKPNKTLKDEY